MSARLWAYLIAVWLVAALVLGVTGWQVLAATPPAAVRFDLLHAAAWIVICVLSESLWLQTISGVGTVTMASTAGLASIMLWGQAPACWIGAVSTLIAELFLLRKPPIRATFNAGQTTLTTWVSAEVFARLGGPAQGLHAAKLATGLGTALHLTPAVLGLFVTYLLVSRPLVSVPMAWSTERPYLRVLREEWFYLQRLIDDAAAFLLSPLMVLSFEAISYAGPLLFFAPLRMFNESHRRYLELQKAQRMIIHSERMAAKGEMAAEIGHELRNILSAISARAQMITKESERGVHDNLARHTQIILEQSKRMETMSRGLMDFSHAELKIERVDLNALLQRTIEFVRTTNSFDGIEWDLALSAQHPELRADPGQLQQVFMNLFRNAAEAMNEQRSDLPRPKRLTVATVRDDRARHVTISIADTGPGIPMSNLSRIFEPHFTTKPTGHGFGLSTSYRIIENHKGRIAAESPPGGGACFILTLPMQGPGAWG